MGAFRAFRLQRRTLLLFYWFFFTIVKVFLLQRKTLLLYYWIFFHCNYGLPSSTEDLIVIFQFLFPYYYLFSYSLFLNCVDRFSWNFQSKWVLNQLIKFLRQMRCRYGHVRSSSIYLYGRLNSLGSENGDRLFLRKFSKFLALDL